jgi:hypothetical protein
MQKNLSNRVVRNWVLLSLLLFWYAPAICQYEELAVKYYCENYAEISPFMESYNIVFHNRVEAKHANVFDLLHCMDKIDIFSLKSNNYSITRCAIKLGEHA